MMLGLRLLPLFQRTSPLLQASRFNFSEYFDNQDFNEMKDMTINHLKKTYVHYKLTDNWKKPLQKKEHRKTRKLQLAANRIPPAPQHDKLVIHNPALGVEYPPKQHQQFAIIQVDGFQYKVLEDTILILDTKKNHVINQPIIFDNVPLLGTRTYTLVGRPTLLNARVEAIVESISASEKVIVFKKKRRKQYKKSFGSRVSLSQCRITKIIHEIEPSLFQKAVGLN